MYMYIYITSLLPYPSRSPFGRSREESQAHITATGIEVFISFYLNFDHPGEFYDKI
jgi:hypothetical protein